MEHVRYYIGGVFTEEFEIDHISADKRDFYFKAYFNEKIKYAEAVHNYKISRVIYFNVFQSIDELTKQHFNNYGEIEFETRHRTMESNFIQEERFLYGNDGKLISCWKSLGSRDGYWDKEILFSPEGEKLEEIENLYNSVGELYKEIHYRGDGTFWYDEEIE